MIKKFNHLFIYDAILVPPVSSLNDSSVNVLHSSDIFNSWTDCSEIIMGGRIAQKRRLIFIQEWLTILRKEAEE